MMILSTQPTWLARTVLAFLLLGAAPVLADPHVDAYYLKFPPPAATGVASLADFNARADVVYTSVACGREEDYLGRETDGKMDENVMGIVLAKLIVYSRWPAHAQQVGGNFLCTALEKYRPDPRHPRDLTKDQLSDQIRTTFGDECAGVVRSKEQVGLFVELTYALTRDCLRKQINKSISRMQVKGTIGSTGLLCWPPRDGLFITEGEWNITVRDLLRIYYINDATGRVALDEDTRIHIRNDLLTIDGRPGPESYNIGECGNQEQSTGPPEERVEEDEWLDNVLDDVGDALVWLGAWLARILSIVVPLVIAGAILTYAFGGAGVALLIALGATGAVALTIGTIPETENHRLMIESDRYLTNQVILAELEPGHSGRSRFEDAQAETREWLLKRLQRIAKEEFVEYNSRAYQRYSMHAIRSLFDFAHDRTLVLAARNVLDLASSKMAIGSNQGRRLVPYRRLMENLPPYIEGALDAETGIPHFNGLMDLESGADHQIGAMLMYAGQTQQAPHGGVSYYAAQEMVFIASSRYRPPESVVDLAVDKSRAYQQRFKHHGVETYSSTPGFLLTAGGIRTGPSSTIEFAGISAGGSILGIIPLSNNKDRGAAVPTTLMLTAGSNRTHLQAFLRINGRRDALDTDNATYDHNLCVWRGFACGLNMQTPLDMTACFDNRPQNASTKWSFFDSKSCPPYQDGPQVMIARYLESCTGDLSGDCVDNLGFFEAVSEPGVTFAEFQQRIVQNNRDTAEWLTPVSFLQPPLIRVVLTGTYISFSNEAIEFNTAGHQLDGDDTGIVSVNGTERDEIDDWDRADGDVMTGDEDTGRFRFVNPLNGHGFSIDMSAWDAPSRQDF